jgi:hypothetical protein
MSDRQLLVPLAALICILGILLLNVAHILVYAVHITIQVLQLLAFYSLVEYQFEFVIFERILTQLVLLISWPLVRWLVQRIDC